MAQPTFHHAIAQRAAAHPGHLAYRTPARDWTYAEVDAAANRVAGALRGLGLGAGDRVACLTRHVVECTVLVLAANKIGAVCMPVNWRLAGKEVEYIVNHGEARMMMADAEFLPLLDGLDLRLLTKTIATLAVPGAPVQPDCLTAWSADQPPVAPAHVAGLHDTALQLYSSGTTGRPKGVELSHRNLIGVCETIGEGYGYVPLESITFNAAPTFHIGGLGMSFVALYAGSTTVAHADFDPARVIAALGEFAVTHTFMVPAMIHLLLQEPGVAQADFSALQVIGYGASPITEKVLVDAIRVFRCRFIQNCGLTETTGTIVALPPEDHDPGGPRAHLLRAAGKPCPGTRLRIVDTVTGEDLPEGETGEVWVHAPQNMIGYWRNEAATREAYPEGRQDHVGWFRSGDAGYLRDGYLFIQDRIKDMIISGGENIYPIEVENVLMQHPGVLDCAVIAVPDEQWGECVKACVVPRPGQAPGEQALIDFCRERLARYKSPRTIDFMAALPRNPSGKLLALMTQDFGEAAGAFAQKRPPRYTGC